MTGDHVSSSKESTGLVVHAGVKSSENVNFILVGLDSDLSIHH